MKFLERPNKNIFEKTQKNLTERTVKPVSSFTVKVESDQKNNNLDESVSKYKEAKEGIRIAKESRVSRTSSLSSKLPLGHIEPADYNNLEREGVLDKIKAHELYILDDQITLLSLQENKAPELEAKLYKLQRQRYNEQKRLQIKIEEKQFDMQNKISNLRNKVVEHSQQRINNLEKTISKLRTNPEIEQKLNNLGLVGKVEAPQELQNKVFTVSHDFSRSIEAKHTQALDKVNNLIGDDLSGSILLAHTKREDEKYKIFNKARQVLIQAIRNGQIQNPSELVPWLRSSNQKSSVPYMLAYNFLRDKGNLEILKYIDNEASRKILSSIESSTRENRMFLDLFGQKFITDPITKKTRQGEFWTTIENTNDRNIINRRDPRDWRTQNQNNRNNNIKSNSK